MIMHTMSYWGQTINYLLGSIQILFFFQSLLYFILKEDRPTAMEDAMLVVNAYSKINEDMLYTFLLSNLISKEQVKFINLPF